LSVCRNYDQGRLVNAYERLGELAYQRNDLQHVYEDARSRARNLQPAR
jgi:hypothetical protein